MIEDWWRELRRHCADNPDFRLEPDLDWDPDVQRKGDEMAPHVRIPLYRAFQAVLDRPLTPDERIKLDRLLDSFGVSRR